MACKLVTAALPGDCPEDIQQLAPLYQKIGREVTLICLVGSVPTAVVWLLLT